MTSEINDPCFLYSPGILRRAPPFIRGATCLQTDETFNVGTTTFKYMEQQAVKTGHKRAEELEIGTFQAFNASRVNKK